VIGYASLPGLGGRSYAFLSSPNLASPQRPRMTTD
jgi:hypothetical protein